MPSVGPDGHVSANFQHSLLIPRPYTHHPAVFFEEVGDLCLHLQVEGWIAPRLLDNEIKKIHCGINQEFAVRRQVSEISHRDDLVPICPLSWRTS
jgi:hypothetical protein